MRCLFICWVILSNIGCIHRKRNDFFMVYHMLRMHLLFFGSASVIKSIYSIKNYYRHSLKNLLIFVLQILTMVSYILHARINIKFCMI